jgi:hypothetical protein
VQTWASNRQAPLGDAERLFLREYLRDLRGRVADRLDPPTLGDSTGSWTPAPTGTCWTGPTSP